MSLVPCPTCSAAISSNAEKCPKCGSLSTAGQRIFFECSECGASLPLEHEGPCPECGDPEPGPSVILSEEPAPQAPGTKPVSKKPRESVLPEGTTRPQPAGSKPTAAKVPDPVTAHREAEAQRLRLRIDDLRKEIALQGDQGKMKRVWEIFTEGLGCVFSFGAIFVLFALLYATRNTKIGNEVVLGLFAVLAVLGLVVFPIMEAASVRRHAREAREREVELRLLKQQLEAVEASA